MPRSCILSGFLLAAMVSCRPTEKPVNLKTTLALEQCSWLLGHWEYTSVDSVEFRETWERQNDSLFGGFGFMKKGDSVLSSEIMSLTYEGAAIYFIARPSGQNNDAEVRFRITSLDSTGFTCENPEHDFPTRIAYRHHGFYPNDSLKAVISGPGQNDTLHAITFAYGRVDR